MTREKFNSLIEIDDMDCWRWTGGSRIFYKERRLRPVNMAMIFAGREPQKGEFPMARCGNTWCCNPDHRVLLTRREYNLRADPMGIVKEKGAPIVFSPEEQRARFKLAHERREHRVRMGHGQEKEA